MRVALLAWAAANTTARAPAQEDRVRFEPVVRPIQVGWRLDDNVFRATNREEARTDRIASLEAGAGLEARAGKHGAGSLMWTGALDVYDRFGSQDNHRQELNLSLLARFSGWRLHYHKGAVWRLSAEENYDYMDSSDAVEIRWSPFPAWDTRAGYRLHSREYRTSDPVVRARNFVEDSASGGVGWQAARGLRLETQGFWKVRDVNRLAVRESGNMFTVLEDLQRDVTLQGGIGVRWLLASVLQEVLFQISRTESNSDGFSHRTRSASWAGVVNPTPDLFVYLFVRLFEKRYDRDPFRLPEFELGFNEEEGQDLLSAKVSWEWKPAWTLSFSAARLHNESPDPNRFYVKHVVRWETLRRF